MRVVNLYTEESEFVDIANIPDDRRPAALVEWRDRHFLRHSDGNYYEAECVHAVTTEQHLERDGEST